MPATVAVVGGSAVGLPTALALQSRGHRVKMWFEKGPGDGITADFSAGIGTPFCHPDPFVIEHFFASYPRYMELARNPLCPSVMFSPMNFAVLESEDLSWTSRVEGFRQISATEVYFDAYTIDPLAFNQARLAQIVANGGTIEKRPLYSDEVARILKGESFEGCDYTLCAMGLGAQATNPDFLLYPTRGLIVHFPRRDDPSSYMDQWNGVYFVSRPDAFLVAGTFEPHVGTCSEDEKLAIGERIVRRMNATRGTNVNFADHVRITVGYRPTGLQGLIYRFMRRVGYVNGLGGQGLVTGESLSVCTAIEIEKQLALPC